MAELNEIEKLLSPEDLAAAQAWKPAQPESSEVVPPVLEEPLDEVKLLSVGDLVELAIAQKFDPVSYLQSKGGPGSVDTGTLQKLGDIHGRLVERGFELSDVSLKGAAKAVGGMLKGGFMYAKAALQEPQLGVTMLGTPEEKAAALAETQKQKAEMGAATELAATGLGEMAGRVIKKVGRMVGLAKEPSQKTPQERTQDFLDAFSSAEQQQKIAAGQGPMMQTIGGNVIADLKNQGVEIDPATVSEMSAGDPLTFVAFGRGFQVINKATGKMLATTKSALGADQAIAAFRSAQRASQSAQKLATQIPSAENLGRSAIAQAGEFARKAELPAAGKVIVAAEDIAAATKGLPAKAAGAVVAGAGKLAEMSAKPIQWAVSLKVPQAVGIVKGAAAGGPVGALAGLKGGEIAATVMERAAGRAIRIGQGAERLGAELGGATEARPWVQAAADALNGTADVLGGTARGAVMDLGFNAATSETPAETANAPAFGMFFGAVHGLAPAARRLVQGQTVRPRTWAPSNSWSASYGHFPSLDAANAEAMKIADPAVQQRIGALRDLGQSIGAEIYLMPDSQTSAKALQEMFPGESPERIQRAANTKGMSLTEVTDANGTKRRVILVRHPDAAPHEAFHPMQDVLGERANEVIDNIIAHEYGLGYLEQRGRSEAARLTGADPGENWADALLHITGYRLEELRQAVSEMPTEQFDTLKKQLALQYAAREVAADLFDLILKHSGPELAQETGAPGAMARILGKVMVGLGINPYEGVRTESTGRSPVGPASLEAVREAAKPFAVEPKTAAPPIRPEVGPKAPRPAAGAPTTPVFTPEQRATEQERVNALAATIRDPKQADVLSKIGAAIGQGLGLKVEYRTAPGEPAGSPTMSREERRAVIEAFRDMPESERPLWEKLNFPDRMVQTSKGPQILGWSPENYAANAHKMARWLADVATRQPDALSLSPYPIDPKTKTFTPEGWRQLYIDAQTFVRNQQAGGAGAGVPMTFPPNAAELGIVVPPARVGDLTQIPQNVADFHNVLFNVMLPETPRVSRKAGVPGNIVAQEMATAMEPLVGPRVTEPGRARSTKEFKGFPGQTIKEVNPLRAQMERLGQQAGNPFPQLIEVNQRLNLEHIADVTLAPEAPPIRGVTDVLRAGFQPAEEALGKIKGEDADWRAYVDPNYVSPNGFGGGLQGRAHDVGSTLTSAEQLRAFQTAREEASAMRIERMKAGDFDGAMRAAGKAQFAKEVIETATGGGSADFIKSHFKPEYKAPLEGVQFEPKATPEIEEKLKGADPVVKNKDNTPKIFYHGTGASDRVSESEGFTVTKMDPNALYGPGVYLTESPEIAGEGKRSYAHTTPGGAGGVIPAFVNIKKVFRIDQYYTEESVRKLNPNLDEQIEIGNSAPVLDSKFKQRLHEALREEMRDPYWLGDEDTFESRARELVSYETHYDSKGEVIPDSQIDAYIDWLGKDENRVYEPGLQVQDRVTGHDLYHSLVALMGSKVSANRFLESSGFGGISHIGGGVFAPGEEGGHRVLIVFDPANVLSALTSKPLVSRHDTGVGRAKAVSKKEAERAVSELALKYGPRVFITEAAPIEELAKVSTLREEASDPSMTAAHQEVRYLRNLLHYTSNARTRASNDRNDLLRKTFGKQVVDIREKLAALRQKLSGTFQAESEGVQFQAELEPEKIRGGTISPPKATYKEAATATGNPWVRQTDAPDNTGRLLMVQISSNLINAQGAKDVAATYYDKLYSGARKGYARMDDFWEIPQWIGFASHTFPNADTYVVRDMTEARKFINEAGYDRVLFSALDTNKELIRDLVKDYPGKVDIGGYVEPTTFSDIPNVKWHDTMKSLADDLGVEYKEGVDYRHFAGSDVIPRLTMSKGCKHKCAFCTVPKKIEVTPSEVVNQQADQIAKLGSKLVYLNDKTFGQAENYETLPAVYDRIKQQNPDFGGFIIQTTASQMTRFTPEYLAKSGIKFVELGVETYNDPILHELHKPATEALIDRASQALRDADIALIPNIIIGFLQETKETYDRTLKFLQDNADIISHVNIYNLALYKDAELGKKIQTLTADDFNENVLEKSFHANPEIHRVFAGDVYGKASEMLDQPLKAKYQPEGEVEHIRDMKELWEFRVGGIYQPGDRTDREIIQQAAIRVPSTGEVFTGPFHGAALEAAMNAKKIDQNGIADFKAGKIDSGFTTSEGRFVGGEEAHEIALAAGQVKAGSVADRTAQRLSRLESFTFGEEQEQGPREMRAGYQPEWTPEGRAALEESNRKQREAIVEKGRRLAGFSRKIGAGLGFRKADEMLTAQERKEIEAGENNTLLKALRMNGVHPDYQNGTELSPEAKAKLDSVIAYHREITGQAQPEWMAREEDFKEAARPVANAFARGLGMRVGGDVKFIPFAADRGVILFDARTEGDWPSMVAVNYQKEGDGIAFRAPNSNFKVVVPVDYGLPPGEPQATVVGKAIYENWKREGKLPPRQAQTMEEYEAQKAAEEYEAQKAARKKRVKEPAKKESAWTIKPAAVSKVWILPDGAPIQLGATWHHDWLDKNKDVQKRYGLNVPKFTGTDSEKVREDALKKGFVRVNYLSNSGTLTVEATAQAWRKQKEAVRDLVDANLGKIDNMEVNLFNPTITKVVDSDSARLFEMSPEEKMNNLPLISGEMRGQFQPRFSEAWISPDGELHPAPEGHYSKAGELLEKQLGVKAVTALFDKFDKGPDPMSDLYDVMLVKKYVRVVIDPMTRAVHANASGGWSGLPKSIRTTLEDLAESRNTALYFNNGKVADFSKGFQAQPEETQLGFEGIGGRIWEKKKIESMTQAELKEHFPEAVVPRGWEDLVPSEITKSPLAKQAGSREEAIKAFADKLVNEHEEWKDNPAYKSGLRWYSEFVPKLKKEFGTEAPLFAELLAATSPQTNPEVNFGYAIDAFQNWKAGKYDKMISKFNEGMDKLADGSLEAWYARRVSSGKIPNPPKNASTATWMAEWIDTNGLNPTGSGEKLFGQHSTRVLRVLARRWVESNTGPKTSNFLQNLLGTGHEATIDLWADRTMRRLGYEGFEDRWRILPNNAMGVSDEDFAFSQAAFREAANRIGIKPDALQGGLWFSEKQRWAENGWGRLDLGDYREEMTKLPYYRGGVKVRQEIQKRRSRAKTAEQEALDISPRTTTLP